MKIFNQLSKSFALVAIIGAMGMTSIASAHEADCPYCKLKLVQNTKEQDNEVVVKVGNKRIEYRCLYCVIKDQKRYKGDLVVYSPSEKVGEPVILKRTAGKWSAPEGATFLNAFKKHGDCAALSRAFSSKSAFEAYLKKNPSAGAKPLTLDQFLAEVAKS
ncbi:MAG: hypothetical protein KF743_13535 [Fimbriimonadaceae bacterium]|nr:hypothetical protein [Fimbriimonadaceae bacterium]